MENTEFKSDNVTSKGGDVEIKNVLPLADFIEYANNRINVLTNARPEYVTALERLDSEIAELTAAVDKLTV